jgi:succinate dehydrogenase / fumarate reductase cytochrome b subunit
MSPPRVLSSSIGTKLVIALTGLVLVAFLVGHLAGNLLILVGADTFNHYAETLVTNPFLVPAELGLLAVFLAHVYKTVRMFAANRRARPVPYQVKRPAGPPSRKSFASSTMILSGVVTFVFVVLHLKTFKYGPSYAAPDGIRDLNRLVLDVFAQPGYVAFYVVCMAIIGSHLRHGVSSAFQSLGLDHPVLTPWVLRAGRIAAVAIGAGFALIPVWVYLFGGRP